jgi:hypothetical protein
MKWMFKAPEAEVEQATNRGVELIDKPSLNATPDNFCYGDYNISVPDWQKHVNDNYMVIMQ